MRYFSKLPPEEKANILDSVFKERNNELICKQRIISLIAEKYNAYIPKSDTSLFGDLEKTGLLVRESLRKQHSLVYRVNYLPITANSEIITKRRNFCTDKYPKRIKFQEISVSVNLLRIININGEEYPIYGFTQSYASYGPIRVCPLCRSLHNGMCVLKRSICRKYLKDHEIPVKQEGYYYSDFPSTQNFDNYVNQITK